MTEPSEPPERNETGKRRSFETAMQRRPIVLALVVEGALAALALLLAVIFGLKPWSSIVLDASTLGQAVAATVPLAVLVLLMVRLPWPWVEALDRLARDLANTLFARSGPTAVLLVSLMAGIGEELLFRGVMQEGLERLLGPTAALLLASLLFGLAHAVTKAYFLVATLIGIYLGWLYLATGNLLVPILVHFLYDWIVLSRYLRLGRDTG